jgi:hypothetical protein
LLNEYAAGHIEPVLVELPPLPDRATPPMQDMAAFFALVRGLRLWACDERPLPFACGWVAAKLGLNKQTAWRVRHALVEAGVLVHGETLPGRDKRGTWSFLPGPLRPAPVDVEGGEVAVGSAVEPTAHLGDEALVVGAVGAAGSRPVAAPESRAGAQAERDIGNGGTVSPFPLRRDHDHKTGEET